MTQPPRRRATQRRVTFAVLAVGLGAFALLQSVVSPLLPTIRREFGTSQSAVAWVLVSYLLAATVATPILGRLADRHGKRRMLLVAFLALIVGAVGAAVAPTIHSLIIARVLQGIGGGLLPIAYSIARDTFRPERVPAVIGFMAALLAAGGAVGLVVAGPVAASIGYRWLFVLAAAVLTLAMILAWRFVPDSRPQDGARVGAVSALLLAAWLALLLLGCSLAPTHGWGSPTVIALLVAGLLFLGVWFVNERSSRSALVDMRTMRLPTVWPTNIASLLFGAGMYANFAVLPQFLQTPRSTGFGFGASVTESGLMTLPQAVVMFATGCSAGLVIARFRERITLALGAALALAGYSWLGLAHDHILDIVIGTGLLGMGFGLGLASMTTIVVSSVPDDQTAVASGMNANIRTMGGAFGAAVVSSILGAQMTAGMPLERGFVYCFALLAALMLLAVVAAVALPSQPRAARPSVRHVEVTAVPSDVGAVPVLIRDKLPRRGADEAAGPAEPVVTVTPRSCDALRGGSRDG